MKTKSGWVCASRSLLASMALICLTISAPTTVRARTGTDDAGSEGPSLLVFCTGLTDGTPCDDGVPCTAGETCQGQLCVAPLTFFAPGTLVGIGTGTGPRAVVTGDWNGDGVLDLAVANRTSNDVTILKGDGSGGFATLGSTVGVGNGPIAIAVGDWNGNGVRDLAVANSSSNTVSILMGDGAGGFTVLGSAVPVGNVPVSVAAGDWNGDGKADLAVANQNSNNVSILLGNGAGGFVAAPIPTVATDTFPVSVVAGDWNGDGRLDLAVANQTSNKITILLGVGNGEFGDAPGSPVAVAGGPFSITAFDSRGNGILDLAVVSITGNTVTVLLGNGTGGFSAGSPIAVGTGPRSVAARDLNRDGRLDLAVANFGTNNVTVLLGDGLGGFAAIGAFSQVGATGPSAVVGGDMTGDGQQDLAVVNTNSNNVTIWKNTTAPAANGTACNDGNPCTTTDVCQSGVCAGTPKADGSACDDGNPCTVDERCRGGACVPPVIFGLPAGSPVAVGTGPRSIVTGDWNGDFILDLAVANRTANSVSILLGDGTGGFTGAAGSPFSFGLGPIAIAVGDWDGNGTSDLALANSNAGANSVTILLGNGTGSFSQAAGSPVATGTVPVAVAAGDLNGDGKLDLAVANQNSNNVTILLGNGAGGFTQPLGSPVTVGTTPVSVAIGDWNGDAKLDLAVANQGVANNLTILLGNGAGGFTTATGSPVATGTGPFSIAVGDLNGDGRPDLAVANNGSSDVTVLLSSGAGTFSPAAGSPIAVGTGPRSVVVWDVNGDGRLDLAVANFGTNSVTVLLGNGLGGFAAIGAFSQAGATGPSAVAGGDLTGDGRQDLVVANTNTNNVTVFVNSTPVAANGTVCNDLNPCTQTDRCQFGFCTGANPVACTPSDTCHSGQCSVATGACSNPRLPNGNACSDGSACTSGDTCGSGTCNPGAPVVCNDGNPCNGVETCTPATGCVAGTPLNCNDGNVCNGVETCSPATGCVAGTPLNCNDGNVCTTDNCNTSTGCIHDNNFALCDDGNPCTDNDTCLNGTCEPGFAASCSDSDPCTIDSCNPATGCVHVTPPPNDRSVDYVIAFGQIPYTRVGPQAVQASIRNRGANAIDNLPVTLNVTSSATGGQIFTDTQTIAHLPACTEVPVPVTFAPFTVTAIEDDTLTVTVPADDDLTNNTKSRILRSNDVLYSYKYPGTTASGGLIENGLTIDIAAKFTITQPAWVVNVQVEFFAATNGAYRVAIYGESAPGSGIPALTPIYVDSFDRHATIAGTVTSSLPSAIPVGPGPFFVGIRQVSTVGLWLGYDDEMPIRSNAFFAASPQFGPDWFSFSAPSDPTRNPYKMNIGAELWLCIGDSDCNDSEFCTIDTCNTTTHLCLHTPRNNGLLCNDSNACTNPDSCSGGVCTGGPPVQPPAEVQGVAMPDKVTLTWSPAARANSYSVARGLLSGLPVGPGGGDEICFGGLGAGTSLNDPATPGVGTGFWYLPRGQSTCGVGSYGNQGNHGTPGAPRVTSTCP